MTARIVGVSGQAGAGKDTIADRLVTHHGFVRVGFADPMKRFCQEVFDFTADQVWGTIEHKNAGDARYPRPGCKSGGAAAERLDWRGVKVSVPCLSPRYALQTLGTEWGRDCYSEIWVEYALRVASRLLAGDCGYQAAHGTFPTSGASVRGVVFSDCRFRNEMAAVKRAGGVTVRVKRPGADGEVGISGHRSEAEQQAIPDAEFDHVIDNGGSLADLYAAVDRFAEAP